MTDSKKIFGNYLDILGDDRFVEWMLMGSDELARYWADFVAQSLENKENLNLAITAFKSIRLNHKPPSAAKMQHLPE